MANYLQGDLAGTVSIPAATGSGQSDFSIVFDSVSLDSVTEDFQMLAGGGATNFIGLTSANTITARIANSTLSGTYDYSGRIGELAKVEVSYLSGNVQLLVDDVLVHSQTIVQSADPYFDTFFAYNNGNYIGAMEFRGLITLTGLGATRTYNTDGTGTNLVDTTSAQNGTLSGFTTGGFLLDDSAPVTYAYDVVLLIGQSNMVGRYGPVDPILDAVDPLVYQYGSDTKVIAEATDPLDHLDETFDTVGMGLTFGKAMVQAGLDGDRVLLVPAADGGTSFASGFWRPGGLGYNNAIARANEAIALGDAGTAIKAILWHQGESDKNMTELEYATDIDSLIADLRTLITGATDTPFIVGGISVDSLEYGAGVQAALEDLPNRVSNTSFVGVEGVPLGADSLHFTAASVRTLGDLYHTAYVTLGLPTSTINITATGMPDGTYKAQFWDDSLDPMMRISVNDVTFSSGTASAIITASVGTAIYTRIDTLTPFVTGATDLGVTE